MPYIIATFSMVVTVAVTAYTYQSAQYTARLRTELAQTRYDVTGLDTIVHDMQVQAASYAIVRRSVPDGHAEVAIALGSVEVLAKDNKVTLEMRVDDAAKSDSSGVKSLTVIANAAGTFTDIRTFLSSLSRLPYHTQVQTMTMDSSRGTLAGTVTLKLFIK